jgi:hypothetical protein
LISDLDCPLYRSLEAALDNIPAQLRDSIIRLSEQQVEEEEAKRRAEMEERGARRSRAEAARISAGQGAAGRRNVQKTRIVAFEEELEDEEDALEERVRMRGLNGDSEGSDDGEAVTVRVSYNTNDTSADLSCFIRIVSKMDQTQRWWIWMRSQTSRGLSCCISRIELLSTETQQRGRVRNEQR